jgi:hypothetical protein
MSGSPPICHPHKHVQCVGSFIALTFTWRASVFFFSLLADLSFRTVLLRVGVVGGGNPCPRNWDPSLHRPPTIRSRPRTQWRRGGGTGSRGGPHIQFQGHNQGLASNVSYAKHCIAYLSNNALDRIPMHALILSPSFNLCDTSIALHAVDIVFLILTLSAFPSSITDCFSQAKSTALPADGTLRGRVGPAFPTVRRPPRRG